MPTLRLERLRVSEDHSGVKKVIYILFALNLFGCDCRHDTQNDQHPADVAETNKFESVKAKTSSTRIRSVNPFAMRSFIKGEMSRGMLQTIAFDFDD